MTGTEPITSGHGQMELLGILGALYSEVLWALDPPVLMPAFLGMPLFVIGDTALMSLVGHVIFGLVLGLVEGAMLRRRPA